jgi:uncharacterized SAM-dependent methyltransferase
MACRRPIAISASLISPTDYQHVKLKGLYGTYDHALEWLKSPKISAKPKTILWLGSSLGNFTRADVPPFLKGFRAALQPGDSMLIGIDSCKEPERVYSEYALDCIYLACSLTIPFLKEAYNDSEGVTRAFTLNGLMNANRILGTEAFKPDEWEHCGEFVEKDGYHRAFVSPLKDVVIDGVQLKKGERIRIEESWKFSTEEIEHLWSEAGLVPTTVFSTSRGDYGMFYLPSCIMAVILNRSRTTLCLQAPVLLPDHSGTVRIKTCPISC